MPGLGRGHAALDVPRLQLLRRRDAHRAHDFTYAGNRFAVEIGDAHAFHRGDQTGDEVRVLGRHARRAGVGVAAQRLDAAECHHHPARGTTDVRTQRQQLHHAEAGRDLAAGDHRDAVAHPEPDQGVVHEDQTLDQRRADVVRKFERRGPGAALCAVHADEVRQDARALHGLADRQELAPLAHAQLEPDRFAVGQFAETRNELQQPDRRRKRGMAGGRDHVAAKRHPADARDFGRDFRRGQNAAVPRLGALRQLDLDHLDGRQAGLLLKQRGRKRTVGRAAAEIARPDLPDQVAAVLQVVRADAALPRVVGEVAALRPVVEGEDRVAAQRAVAYGRHVQQAGRVRSGAVGPADGRPQVGRLQVDGSQRVVHPFVADLVHVFFGAERQGVAFALGALIDERALLSVERHAVGVVLDEVLVDFRADEFQEIAAVADDGKVAQHRVFRLEIIVQPERDDRPGQQPPPRAGRKHDKIDRA